MSRTATAMFSLKPFTAHNKFSLGEIPAPSFHRIVFRYISVLWTRLFQKFSEILSQSIDSHIWRLCLCLRQISAHGQMLNQHANTYSSALALEMKEQFLWIAMITLRWPLRLKVIQLEQRKTQLPFIILAKNLKPILCRVIKGI